MIFRWYLEDKGYNINEVYFAQSKLREFVLPARLDGKVQNLRLDCYLTKEIRQNIEGIAKPLVLEVHGCAW